MRRAKVCGAGMLDAGAAVGSTIPGTGGPPGSVKVVEYYRSDLDHYFITADQNEIAASEYKASGVFKRPACISTRTRIR
jgi:hypothetical protein